MIWTRCDLKFIGCILDIWRNAESSDWASAWTWKDFFGKAWVDSGRPSLQFEGCSYLLFLHWILWIGGKCAVTPYLRFFFFSFCHSVKGGDGSICNCFYILAPPQDSGLLGGLCLLQLFSRCSQDFLGCSHDILRILWWGWLAGWVWCVSWVWYGGSCGSGWPNGSCESCGFGWGGGHGGYGWIRY